MIKYEKVFLLWVSCQYFFILGCSHQIKIEPNNLPEMKYDNRIVIEKLNIFGELVIKTDLPDN